MPVPTTITLRQGGEPGQGRLQALHAMRNLTSPATYFLP